MNTGHSNRIFHVQYITLICIFMYNMSYVDKQEFLSGYFSVCNILAEMYDHLNFDVIGCVGFFYATKL